MIEGKYRAPTDAEYAEYDGMHCRSLWRKLSDEWSCPICDRTKRQIMRWGKRAGSNALKYGAVGFTCGVHGHHDHGGRWNGRFIICGACNAADGSVKRKLGVKEPFSFSIDELRAFVSAIPNGPTTIDYDTAARLHEVISSILPIATFPR